VVLKTTSAGFDNRGEDIYVALNITSGASDAITIDWWSRAQRPK
jgi:hypothetical protein